MSYILNALKKAEQDRRREDPKDLEDFAGARWDPYQQQASSKTAIYVVVAVLLLLLGFGVAYLGFFAPSAQQSVGEPQIAVPQLDRVTATEPQVVDTVIAPPVKDQVPQLAITGHMYFDVNSASNRVFADGKAFKEGDTILGDWVLLAIGTEGIEIGSAELVEFIPYP
jgi:hypothetical protein